VDLVAISEGLIGDPLLIGLFLCGSSVIVELLVLFWWCGWCCGK